MIVRMMMVYYIFFIKGLDTNGLLKDETMGCSPFLTNQYAKMCCALR